MKSVLAFTVLGTVGYSLRCTFSFSSQHWIHLQPTLKSDNSLRQAPLSWYEFEEASDKINLNR